MKESAQLCETAFDKGHGIFRLSPAWVPRSFCIPGKRLKLHPDDYYAFGTHRGGIDERWLASVVKADNGPETTDDEGLSYINCDDGNHPTKILLRDAIELMGDLMLGEPVMKKFGGWTMFSKFFDNLEPLPFHLHPNDEYAKNVGRLGKPEGYYFPPQLNNHDGCFPYTFFGLHPGTGKDEVKKCLENWNNGDNNILSLSQAYRLQPGAGWDVPAGILHAPGSLLTYEPQRASDVFGMYQSLVWKKYIPWELLVKDVPEAYEQNLDYLIEMIDWENNCDPDFFSNRHLKPKPVTAIAEMHEDGYEENWIVYNSEYFSAKELTVFPGRKINIKDNAAHGLIVVQGHGWYGRHLVESPTLIRFGQLTADELFVTVKAATDGVEIVNNSTHENMVILKHFGPEA